MKRVLKKILLTSGLILGSMGFATSHAVDLSRPDAEKGEQIYLQGDPSRGVLACVTCHGAEGNSVLETYPNLAEQPFEYLVKQMNDFRPDDDKPAKRLGEGGNPAVMAPIVAQMTDEEIRDVAFYVSLQELDAETTPKSSNEDTLEHAQQIWRGGIPDRNVAACAACHAPNGAGIPGEFPRLRGQYPAYLAEQLRLFRDGERQDDIMAAIASRMQDKDIDAIADYAAGLR
ncbi:MAG TPA: c-type cytochrome [Paenalcaligenes sp.]|nr:c-type cytochrome [Paenalcaligenes sp.]